MGGSGDSANLTIAVIGGSGRIGAPFVRRFLADGANTRV
jgi:NAD(P)-dependent dehydrogenase (short-subunit alcohol dehydrogenase family)